MRYQRGGAEHTVWLRLGPAPAETFLPSVLWFFLKIGLFLVGAIVFWKRPGDRSAGQFFLLCLCSFGAYIGGYHWWRIVTQPMLLLVFMVSAILLPAVSLHFYLVFPRPKAFLERWPDAPISLFAVPLWAARSSSWCCCCTGTWRALTLALSWHATGGGGGIAGSRALCCSAKWFTRFSAISASRCCGISPASSA